MKNVAQYLILCAFVSVFSACAWQEKPMFKKYPVPKMVHTPEEVKAGKCNCELDVI